MKKLLKFIFCIILVAICILGYLGYEKYSKAIKDMPLEEKVLEIRSADNYTEFSNIPDTFIDAVVAVEDRRFYKHNGIDFYGILRAVVTDIKERELAQGGSTITQQLAKNMYFPMDNSPVRKIAEMIMAVKLEREYKKEEILELYCNVIYYGKGCYNIHDAAIKYFKKEPIDMTDYEATLLAGIPNAPSVYSVDDELAKKRQDKVLKSMLRSGYISEKEMEKILKDR